MRILERRVHRAPLGIRLLDAVTGRTVSDGLHVTAAEPGGARASAVSNRSDVFVFPRLRGVGDLPSPPTGPSRYELEVDDELGRFHPFSFSVDVPLPGLFELECGSPPLSPPLRFHGVPLYSAPARPVPPGMAVVRAALVDGAAGGRGRPAAWAVLKVTPQSRRPPVTGIADRRGEVAVIFPWPDPPRATGSPPSRPPALTATTWRVALSALYSPAEHAPERRPDLCGVLGQRPATLTMGPPPSPTLSRATLEYGRELRLGAPGQQVYVTPPA